jgi:hypothetical protein
MIASIILLAAVTLERLRERALAVRMEHAHSSGVACDFRSFPSGPAVDTLWTRPAGQRLGTDQPKVMRLKTFVFQ